MRNALRNRLPLLVLAALAGIYIANCFTPLRLNNDTVRYITIKEWMEAGRPAGHAAANEFLPYGYVWFLLILSKLHLAKSFFICFIHLLYLAGSLWFIKKVFADSIRLWHLAALCMLNWATLKFTITPLSEMQFLFFSMGALYFFEESQKGKRLGLLWAALFTAGAMLTRTIGFLLPVAFIISLLMRNRQVIRSVLIGNKWMAVSAASVFVVCFFLFGQFGIPRYLDSHSGYFGLLWNDPVRFFWNNLKFHVIDWSALFLNAPAPKLNMFGSPGLRDGLFFAAGILSFALVIYLLLKKQVSGLIKAYLLCYMAVILNWPLFEPRLWFPVMPLVIAVILQQQHGLIKKLLSAYKYIYILVGVAALGYYTYTSFIKETFAVKHDAAIWRNEYETHFFGKPLSDTATVVREPILELIKKYD